MAQSLAELERKMSELSADDRSRLALFLLESLEPADASGVEQAWRQEAESRLAEVENGTAKLVPADAVFDDLRRRFG